MLINLSVTGTVSPSVFRCRILAPYVPLRTRCSESVPVTDRFISIRSALRTEFRNRLHQLFISYIVLHQGEEGFVEYMNARMHFFAEHENEAALFLETRTHPPYHLKEHIQDIYAEFDDLNMEILERELCRHSLRQEVSQEEALRYFLLIQKAYHFDFMHKLHPDMSVQEQIALHEKDLYKIFDLMLYGIAQRR